MKEEELRELLAHYVAAERRPPAPVLELMIGVDGLAHALARLGWVAAVPTASARFARRPRSRRTAEDGGRRGAAAGA